MEATGPSPIPRLGRSQLASILHHGSLIALLAGGAAIAAFSARYATQERVLVDADVRPWSGRLLVFVLAGAVAALGSLLWCAVAWIRGSWTGTSSHPFRLILYAYTSGAAVELAFLQPFHRASFAAVAAVTAGVAGILVAAEQRLRPRLRSPMARRIDLIAFNACLLVVGLELGLKTLAKVRPMGLLWQEDIEAADKVRAFRYPPGRLRYGFPCNSRGDYDEDLAPPKPDDFLVVSISDSFGVGVVPYWFHFTTVCERALEKTQVYNMGVQASSPLEYLYLLRTEAIPLHPHAIVVNLFMGNDVVGRSLGASFRPWFGRGNLLIYQLPRRLLAISSEGRRQDQDAVRNLTSTMPMLCEDGDACTEAQIVARLPWLLDPPAEPPGLSRETFLAIECERAAQTCGSSTVRYDEMFEVLREIRQAAGAIPLLFTLIPDEFQVEDDLWKDIIAERRGQPLDRNQPQRLIARWLAAEGAPCLDLLPLLRSAAPLSDGRRHCFHLRDTHFNVRGSRIAGEALAGALKGWVK